MTQLTVSTKIYAPLEKVWSAYITPTDIMGRNFASDDRHCPVASNDFRVGGRYNYTMAAKDGSFSFDFAGVYTRLEEMSRIEYVMGEFETIDVPAGRKATVLFTEETCGCVTVTTTFDAESENSLDMQQAGRQAILDNFKKYVEEDK